MLVLSRRVGEKVVIDEKTTVTVVSVKNGTVRLGFEAPRDVPIVRDNARRTASRLSNGAGQ